MNRKLISFAGSLILCFLLSNTAMGQTDPIEAQIEDLLSKMTLEEKVGQMNQYTGFWEVTGPVPEDDFTQRKYDQLKNGLVGSMLNVRGVEDVRALQKLVVEESRLGIPLIFGYDIIHGHKTLSPIPLAEAPMVDIAREARWGRVMEGAGEDPYLGSKIAVARVKGFQGDDLSAPNTIAACAKHFAAYGFAEA